MDLITAATDPPGERELLSAAGGVPPVPAPTLPLPGTRVRYLSPDWGLVEGEVLGALDGEGGILCQDLSPGGAREYWPLVEIQWAGWRGRGECPPCPSSELSEGGTEVLLSHLDPLPTPPRPWWWTAPCVLREKGDIEQQIAYLESVIRTEARRLVPTAPPDDPDPHPTLLPLSGQESVDLYRAAAHVGRLPEVLAAANQPARLRELYSVLCGGGR